MQIELYGGDVRKCPDCTLADPRHCEGWPLLGCLKVPDRNEADRIAAEEGAFLLDQFRNGDNAEAHYLVRAMQKEALVIPAAHGSRDSAAVRWALGCVCRGLRDGRHVRWNYAVR